MTKTETKTIELALGRIFRMGARPTQEGDVAEFDRCRGIILDLLAPASEWTPVNDHGVDYIIDRNKGAQGDH